MILLYVTILIIFFVFSYGFIDVNLPLTNNAMLLQWFEPLRHIVYVERPLAALICCLILLGLTGWYLYALFHSEKLFVSGKKLWIVIGMTTVILACSFSALSYDLFNYMTTAKVAFTHHENPYIVMPVEIPNEPYLAFTRAANKVALYGPVWIGITALPHMLGGGDIWRTIISFKLVNAVVYLLFVYFIYHVTKSKKNVVFFAFNPLILTEVLVSGHNDIVMMLFAMLGLYLWHQKKKLFGLFFLLFSWLTKIPTLALAPLLVLKNVSWDRILLYAYSLMSFVFFVFAPLREELYPWYAVWLIVFAAFFDMKKHSFLIGWTLCLSCALELRHLPYIYMGYYGGFGPMARTLLTVIPLGIYVAVYGVRKYHEHKK